MTKAADLVLRVIAAAFIVVAVALFWISVIVLHGQPRRVVGDYDCHGMVGDKTYAASMEIRADGDAFRVRQLEKSAVTFDGIGLETDGYLAVLFAGRKGLALSLYKADGNVLAGAWTGGDGAVFAEVCTRADLGA